MIQCEYIQIKCEVTTGEAADKDMKGGKMILWIVDNVY